MGRMTRVLIALLMSSIFYNSLFAKTLDLDEVIKSTEKHSPQVLSSLELLNSEKEALESSEGAFDAKFKSKANARTKGFFDGRVVDSELVKPLPFLNSKIYGGARFSEGSFPSYEGKFSSGDEGEYRVGFGLSLLRNRSIDKNRLKIRNQEIKVGKSEASLEMTLVEMKQYAYTAYWNWITLGQAVKTYSQLLDIAVKRDKALRSRFSKGDAAKIYIDENQQYLMKRRAELIKSKQEFFQSSVELSFFLRDSDGQPVLATADRLPEVVDFKNIQNVGNLAQDIINIEARHPDIRKFRLEAQMQQNNFEQGENILKPKLDLRAEVSEDIGQVENRFFVQLEIPIERRKGRGLKAQARAKMKSAQYRAQMKFEQIKNKLTYLDQKITTQKDVLQTIGEEVRLATILEAAEVQRFENGDSDFFVLNMREQNTVSAKLRRLKAFNNLHQAIAHYRKTALSF